MIKGADRKDVSRIIQLRATSEYHCMIDLVSTLLNEKIAEVGGKEKVTSTDVIKLAIQSLGTGDNSFNILGNNISINELVSNKLDEFKKEYSKVIPKKVIEFEVKYFLANKMKEVIDILEYRETVAFEEMSAEELHELRFLEHTVFSREEAFESMRATEDERKAFRLVTIENIDYYIDLIITYKKKFGIEEINYEKLKEEVENNVLNYANLKNLPALKLYDNYRYSFILTSLRKDIDEIIAYIKDYILKQDVELALTAKKEEKSIEEDNYDDIVDYDYDDVDDYYESSYTKDEYNLSPNDPDYEFSISEALDNMYDK